MKKNFLLFTGLLLSKFTFAGAGFWNTLFGDPDHEFVCYSRIHRNYYLAIFFLFLLFGVISWSRYRLKKRTAVELGKQKSIIEEQNKDILDSIRYASRMQHAMKPDEKIIRTFLPDSFFYLRPRDIVSGDFYFVDERDGKIFIAAADCTGHGVPGAFLTFIGNNALRTVIEHVKSNDPSVLIDAMNAEVKKALGQDRAGNNINDGMEVALCVFDPATRELAYAGAGSPLYVFMNNELHEIKAAKCTVGSIQEHVTQAPPSHHFKLGRGDSFYIGSDGIVDQFGGPEGKKFRKENLRKVMKEMHSAAASGQEAILAGTLSEWMQGHSQTDDMLLLGVRV